MNFTQNWRDKRTDFRPMHYSIANYSTETKKEMRSAFGEDLFLNNLHLIPDPLMKNLADTIITEEKMAPKSKLDKHIDVNTENNMHNIEADYSPLSGITSFLSGVVNVISNAVFSRLRSPDLVTQPPAQMAPPSLWQPAKRVDENKMLPDEKISDEKCSELAPDMVDCRTAVAHCQNKIEQVRLLLGSKPVSTPPTTYRSRRRPKRVFVEASSVEDNFEDAFSPEDFESLANDSYIQYSSPVCFHDQFFHEVDSPKVKTEMRGPTPVPEVPTVCETTEIVANVPEDTVNASKLVNSKEELVSSCEDKLSKLKALLAERKKKKTTVEPEPVTVQQTEEVKELPKVKTPTKVKDKRFKNPNRTCSKRMKSKMRKSIEDDLRFANEINIDDFSSVENSPSMGCLEKYVMHFTQRPVETPKQTEKEFFDEVSGRFLPGSVESEDSFQIVFNDCPKLRRTSDCESEDSFIVFEDSPDSCYTSNDVFGETSDDDDEYDSDSDVSQSGDSGCGDYQFNLAASLSKSVCNLTDASLYADTGADEVDFVDDTAVSQPEDVETEDLKTGLLIDDRKKHQRKGLPPKRVQFSSAPPKVHVLRVWAFAARQARAGHWERYALDRDRFKRRIADVEVAVSWVLRPQHRSRIMFQRFMPWWNRLKREELAEKREREERAKLQELEERAKQEELDERAKQEEVALEDVTEERAKEQEPVEDVTQEERAKRKELPVEVRAKQGTVDEVTEQSKSVGLGITSPIDKIDDSCLKSPLDGAENTIDNIKTPEENSKNDSKSLCKKNLEIIPVNDKLLILKTDVTQAIDT
ncbi:uncharacterized protein LOC110381391 [Helicoverpa armigera]|uniref:uncharacterized protein LOC110381391 n=1 Tax=Helicoverpa armigera TaxID=29058 RepID=UPI0030827C4F